MLKNGVNGFPSETRPYLICLGAPLSPSSARTFTIMSPGATCRGRCVMGGADVNTGGISCTS